MYGRYLRIIGVKSNYKVITDEIALKEFITWLPDLDNGETYYYCLFSRRKYDSNQTLKSDKQQLKRGTSSKEFLFEKLKQLEVVVGSYYQKHYPIPQETLAAYITINPRSYEKATKESIKKLVDLVTKPYNGYNPHQEVMSNIQVAWSRKIYTDFDFDNISISEIKPLLIGEINNDCLTCIETRSGFHLLVESSKVDKKYAKSWYNTITQLPNCDVRGDNLCPIPGTYQGGFTPKMIKL